MSAPLISQKRLCSSSFLSAIILPSPLWCRAVRRVLKAGSVCIGSPSSHPGRVSGLFHPLAQLFVKAAPSPRRISAATQSLAQEEKPTRPSSLSSLLNGSWLFLFSQSENISRHWGARSSLLTGNCCDRFIGALTALCMNVKNTKTAMRLILHNWSASRIKMCITKHLFFFSSLFLKLTASGQVNQFRAWRDVLQSEFQPLFNRVIYTVHSQLLVYHHPAHHKAIFHHGRTVLTWSSRRGIRTCHLYRPRHSLSPREDNQWLASCFNNEMSQAPTSLPCAITYSIKFLVCSPGNSDEYARVLISQSQSPKKETLEGWQSVLVDWIPVAAGVNQWRLMLQKKGQSVQNENPPSRVSLPQVTGKLEGVRKRDVFQE